MDEFDRETPVTGCVTVTEHVARQLLFAEDVQVIVAVPGPTPVTVPLLTVATDVLLLDQVTLLLLTSLGETVAVSV